MEQLTLYYLPSCPYCLKVLRFMEKSGIIIDLESTSEPANQQRLLDVGKKNQVPCLFIGEKPLYESDDIIAYLNERFVSRDKT
ncbi:MAG: glutathione S-transferase N-terminal domain-containing protein [Coriobacteriales bacterium]|nr:glutathione S-transferase N-terminal domain-containing protein [Coriobacteriales bacterium]